MQNLILQIHLFHEYYDDGIMKNMRLQPDSATEAFMVRYRLMSRQSQGSYALHYFGPNNAEKFTQSLNHLLNGRPLVFDLHCSDSQFNIMTDLPVDWHGQIRYSSDHIQPQATQQPSIELTMQLQPQSIARIAGHIAIYPKDLLSDAGEMRHSSFSIKMKARHTHWHYYVCNHSKVKLTRPAILDHQGTEFESPRPVTLKNGEQALLFSSGERRFALREKMNKPFNLVNFMNADPDQTGQPRSNAKQLITGLPIPKADTLMIEIKENKQYIYSPMYVFL